jgi:hypothetical protein
MPDDEMEDIEIEAPDDDDEAINSDEVQLAVRRVLVRDEARIMSVVSVGLIAIGVVFAAAWLLLAWRLEETSTTFLGSGGSSGDPDLVDRILVLVQFSGVLMIPLLVVAAGCGLRLYASRVFTADPP